MDWHPASCPMTAGIGSSPPARYRKYLLYLSISSGCRKWMDGKQSEAAELPNATKTASPS